MEAKIVRKPQGGVHAQYVGYGRVFVESVNSMKETALIRFDPGTGMRSRTHTIAITALDFGTVGWDGWRRI